MGAPVVQSGEDGVLRRREHRLRHVDVVGHMVRVGGVVLVHQDVLPVEVEVAGEVVGRPAFRVLDHADDGEAPTAGVDGAVVPPGHLRPGRLQQVRQIRLVQLPVPLEYQLGAAGDSVAVGEQLIGAVPVQIQDRRFRAMDPGQQDGIAVGIEIVVVVEGDACVFVQFAGVMEHQPVVAEQVLEEVHGDGVAVGITGTQRVVFREGEEAVHIPHVHTPSLPDFHVDDFGSIEVAICGTVDIDGNLPTVLAVHAIPAAPLRTVARVSGDFHGFRLIGLPVRQGDRQHRVPLRVYGWDGGLLAGLVGHEPVGAVVLGLQGHAQPRTVIAGGGIRVVQSDGIAHPLPGGDLDAVEVVGIPMGPVIGVIIRQIREVFQSHATGLGHGEAHIFLQNTIHIG